MNKSNKIKRVVITAMATVCALSSATAISASAKTLKESFSGKTTMVRIASDKWGNCTWSKKVTASTSGYYGYHYVRAYVGGSSKSASGALDDSGRKYSYGNVTALAQGGAYAGGALMAKIFIPTGYAKYGY